MKAGSTELSTQKEERFSSKRRSIDRFGKEREIRERGQPSEKKSDIKHNASRTTKSAARAAPTVFFVLCDDNDDDQESDH
jgi:hypothetical protein